MGLWQRLAAFLGDDGRAALVTLVKAEGSTPRDAGARMLIRADGGFSGTIGGGTLEWQAQAQAQALLARGRGGERREFSLGPDLGQCCGGRVTALIEAFDARDLAWIMPLAAAERAGSFVSDGRADAEGVFIRAIAGLRAPAAGARLDQGVLIEAHGNEPTPVLLFGAGHVGRALVLALAPLPFDIRWVDTRAEAFPAHFPGNVSPVVTADPARELSGAGVGTLALIMSHSHALDFDLVAAALPNQRIAFCGLIGSETKRARFLSRLTKMGVAGAASDRLACPVGMPELGKEPAAIAAGIAVTLLKMRQGLTENLSAVANRSGRAIRPA